MPTLPRVLDRQRQESSLRLQLAIPPDLEYFDGHFPRHPVLPGVVQLAWAVHYAREDFGVDPAFQRLLGVKFQRVIAPGQQLTLDLGYAAATHELSFRYVAADGAFSSGRLRFADV